MANNNFFKLPFQFDPERLNTDLQTCRRSVWQLHYNQRDYTGNWTSISLRSASGNANDAYAGPSSIGYRDTPLLAECPYFQEVINQFGCPKETIRLMLLAPGSQIREHRDQGLAYEFNAFRIHIPIQTADDVQFRVAGSNLAMQPGDCWYANFDQPHSVRNDGTTERIHLVIDCLRNDWSDKLFAQARYDFTEENRQQEPSAEVRQQMIAELRRLDTDTARQLIRQLEAKALL
ncbi:aspartyl/asparaginyl beta-hydroxylase domain-containing protein [Spirosoma litoris]